MSDARVGLVLAGGLAERMGECKVLLPINGRPALEIIVSRMRDAGVGKIFVVTGGHAEKIRAEAERLGCIPIHNPDYMTGMFSSILAGVRALPEDTESFFLLPADTPLIKTATYCALTEAFYEGYGNPDVVYPTFGGERGHPPLIGRALIRPILEWSGSGGLRGLLGSYPCKSADVPTGDRSTLLDMDTKDDYAVLLKYAEREFYPDDAECAELLTIAGTPRRAAGHMRMVAKVAEILVDALAAKGLAFERRLLRSACLLHDIAKGRENHERTGANWLRDRGYTEVAGLVSTHTDLPERDELGEAELLYLSDKITDGEVVSTLENRMKRMEERFAADSDALRAARKRIDHAARIKSEVERLACSPFSKILDPSKLYGITGEFRPIMFP